MTDRERAIEICKRLDFCGGLAPEADDNDPYFMECIHEELGHDFGDFEIANGATKGVLIFDDLPFVIKFPFLGLRYFDQGKYDAEEDDYYVFEEFHGADCEEHNNYCQCELERADAIVEAGFGEFVAKTELLYVNEFGFKFYIQEKVTTYAKYYDSNLQLRQPSEESRKKSASLDRIYQYCTEDWRAFAIESYGEEKWIQFIDWVKSTKPEILSDMHGGNFGYRFDGTPVFLDISGYDDQFIFI